MKHSITQHNCDGGSYQVCEANKGRTKHEYVNHYKCDPKHSCQEGEECIYNIELQGS